MPPPLAFPCSFISQIADVSMMESHMREIGYDTTRAPLGKMKKETVLKGYEVLKQLSVVIMGATDASSSGSGASGGASGGGGSSGRSLSGSDREAIEALTNSFYSVIPHASPRNVKLPLISTPQLLKQKIEMVEALGEIEIFSRTMDTKDPSFDVHPIDNKYAQLGIKLTPVDVGSSLHVLLDDYMQNTHAATHANYKLELTQAFEVEREGEAARFKETIGNIQLLWHGSRLTNWCGILGQGLRIAPPEAPVTGYMFGKGVYFGPHPSQSEAPPRPAPSRFLSAELPPPLARRVQLTPPPSLPTTASPISRVLAACCSSPRSRLARSTSGSEPSTRPTTRARRPENSRLGARGVPPPRQPAPSRCLAPPLS